jgi:hypothetical protein
LKFCRQESAKSRTLTPDDLTLYRKSKQPFILHPYDSFPSVSPKPSNTATAAGTGTATGASIVETSATPSTAGALSLPVLIPSSDPVPPALPSCGNAHIEAEESVLNTESNDIMDIDYQEDGLEKEQDKILLKKNDDFPFPAAAVTPMTLDSNTPETPDVIKSHPVTSPVISSTTDTVNSSGLSTNILDSDPRSAEILESDPTSHTILKHVNPLCTTDLLQTDSYDIYDAEDIDSYFDCLTDSKSWDESDICDILNDTEVHEVVEDLIAKVVEIASNQEKFNTCTQVDSEVKEIVNVLTILDSKNKSCALIRSDSENVEIENKDQYDNDGDDNSNNNEVTNDNSGHCEGGGGPDGDSDESALSRYEHDVSAGMDDVAHKDSYIWQTARRWTAATVKVLLGALIEYVFFILPSYYHNSFVLSTEPYPPYHTLPCPALKNLQTHVLHLYAITNVY